MSVEITKGIVEAVKGYLQEEGIKFFRELKRRIWRCISCDF